ncbi:hypothetical protein JXA70_04930, partial [candidate division KSB1 bacterium]|nr:hypothetical protein [candidate division KSB1 bacterium]
MNLVWPKATTKMVRGLLGTAFGRNQKRALFFRIERMGRILTDKEIRSNPLNPFDPRSIISVI